MKRFLISLGLVLITFAAPAHADPTGASDPATLATTSAEQLIDTLAREDFAAVFARFDAAMKRALPEERLRGVWLSMRGQIGPFRGRRDARVEQRGSLQVVHIGCEFRDADLEARVSFNSRGEVCELRFLPPRPASP